MMHSSSINNSPFADIDHGPSSGLSTGGLQGGVGSGNSSSNGSSSNSAVGYAGIDDDDEDEAFIAEL